MDVTTDIWVLMENSWKKFGESKSRQRDSMSSICPGIAIMTVPWVTEPQSWAVSHPGWLLIIHHVPTQAHSTVSQTSLQWITSSLLFVHPAHWWAAVYGVTQSRTWLKRLSSSSTSVEASSTSLRNVLSCVIIFTCVCVKSFQSCPALCDTMDGSLPGSSVDGIFQARILEWVAMPSSRGLPDPGIKLVSLTSPASSYTLIHKRTAKPN